MKRLIEWLMPNPPQRLAPCKADQSPVSVRVRPTAETKDEHVDEPPFGWFGTDNADSSVFDTGSLKIEKSEKENAVSHRRLELVGDSPCNSGDDTGFEPYNSGRFKSKVK